MRRALLIGSQIHGLTGVHADLVRVEEALGLFGFECLILKEEGATHDGILAAIRGLIANTVPEDAVLLYYTGHGGLVVNGRKSSALQGVGAALDEPRVFQYIVPTDHSAANFSGIFSAELSALVVDLTMKTRNVTVVLDCCHATGQVLDGEVRFIARAVSQPWTGDIATYVDSLRAQGYDLSARAMYVESNPHAVRLVACAADQTAYESIRDNVVQGGLLTEAFVQVLHEVHALSEMPPWDALGKLIRERVRAVLSVQHPDVQGPLGRRLFTVEDTERTDIFAYAEDDGLPQLRGGALHGIQTGDRFLVMPVNAARPDYSLALAELEAETVATDRTLVKVAAFPARPPLQPGARAFRVESVHRRHAVRVTLEEPLATALGAAIAASPRLALAGPNAAPLATLTADADGTLELRDEHGVLARRAPAFDIADIPPIIRTLEQFARVRELLDLRGGIGDSRLSDAPKVEWGRLGPDGPEPLPPEGARLRREDRIYIRVHNPGSRQLNISILGVGVERSITLLSGSEPHGIALFKGETYVLGLDSAGQLLGVPLLWPDDVPTDEAQPLAFVVVATDLPVDLRSLEVELHDAGELFARLRKTPGTLPADAPPQASIRGCRMALTHLSAALATATTVDEAPSVESSIPIAPSLPITPSTSPRDMDRLRPGAPSMPSEEVSVLFITTEPEDQARPEYTRELQAIQSEMWLGSVKFNVEHAFHSTRQLVVEALARHKPKLVHFVGHGSPEGLMIEDDDRTATLVSEAWLTKVFAACPTVQLVVLNACKSAGLARALATSPRTAISGAIGWTDVVTEHNARRLATTLYKRLALRDTAQSAFDFATTTMKENDAEYASLELRGEDFALVNLHAREEELDRWEAELFRRETELSQREPEVYRRQAELGSWEAKLLLQEKDLIPRKADLDAELATQKSDLEMAFKKRQKELEAWEVRLRRWEEQLIAGIVTPPPLRSTALPFTPSNIHLDGIDIATLGDVEVNDLGGTANTEVADISGRMKNGNRGFTIVDQDDGTRIAVYVFRNVRIGPNASLTFNGANAGALVALDTMTIYGGITATAGGFRSDKSLRAEGGGPGGGWPARDTNASGGGSYGGRGGEGAAVPEGEPGAPGAVYGNPELIPLMGGSSGGAKGGGQGGGAIQLVAGKRLFIGKYGYINSGGHGGDKGFVYATTHGHGGGSGGAILLEAPIVEVEGVLAANGGGGGGSVAQASDAEDGFWSGVRAAGGYQANKQAPGGAGSGGTEIDGEAGKLDGASKASGGGGGAGRIRINTSTGQASITGTVSPALSTDCSTQGTLVMTEEP